MYSNIVRGVLISSCLLFFTSFTGELNTTPSNEKENLSAYNWVESSLDAMTLDEKIGQLFMVAAYTNRDEAHVKEIDALIRDYHIGGLIFFQDDAQRQAELTNHYQLLAKTPLMIGIDGEWGLAMRLKYTPKFPRQMTLGATRDPAKVYQMGKTIARHCSRLGIHVNFAPVVDVNVNKNNPVIGTRAFGEERELVSQLGLAYMHGMQDHGVLACAKHFPGHGDTDMDSHLDLPTISHDRMRLDSIELYPFKKLMADSLASIMVAHIHVPAYDNAHHRATTLSHYVVTDLLRDELGYEGLVFTDALNMQGVSKYYHPGETDLLALLAGNDVLLFSMNVPKAIHQIKKALKKGLISKEELDTHVRRILMAKYTAGLHKSVPIAEENIYTDLNTPKVDAQIFDLYRSAITLAKNEVDCLPINEIPRDSIVSISFYANGDENEQHKFQDAIDLYAPCHHLSINKARMTPRTLLDDLDKIKKAKYLIIGWFDVNRRSGDRLRLQELNDFIKTNIPPTTKVIYCHFGNPYVLDELKDLSTIICAYENRGYTQEIVPQIIFGALAPRGKLPVTICPEMPYGKGETFQPIKRIGISRPELEGLDTYTLNEIESIATKAIDTLATPGCQVIVLKGGKIVYELNAGSHRYLQGPNISAASVYDIASITKVAATMQAVMKLTDEGKIDLEKKLKDYFPETDTTDKGEMRLRDVLSHQAGLFPFLQHWRKGLTDDGGLDSVYFSRKFDELRYPNKVADSLYSLANIRDSIWQWSLESKLIDVDKETGKYPYRYSDIGFYILQRLVETVSGQSLDEYVDQNFYQPLGLRTTTFNPLNKYPRGYVVPSEEDQYFRNQLVEGYVHDPGAAMMGGVAGHAGVFSNARDLATLFQMNLWNGTYAGKKYFSQGTIDEFTRKQFEKNRRGIGWDKPQLEGGGGSGELASPNAFGHSGFTGTIAWVDPDYDLVYVFLSNRVFPKASNTILLKTDVRTRIHDTIYQAMLNFEDN